MSGVLSVKLHFACGPRCPRGSRLQSGPRFRSSLGGVPGNARTTASGPSPGDLADPHVQRRWIPGAVLEYDGVQLAAPPLSGWGDSGDMLWEDSKWRDYRFDVTAVSTLTVRLLAWPSDEASEEERRRGVVVLGSVTVNPFEEAGDEGRGAYVDLDEGAGELHIETKFQALEFALPPAGEDDYGERQITPLGDLVQVAGRSHTTAGVSGRYGMTTCAPESHPETEAAAPRYCHPFIAQLKFAFRSPEGVHLLCRMGDGGNLFGHLQQERRFPLEKVKFYGAELVCVLEYLHGNNVVASLKPENIWLDPFGHISLCSPGLFELGSQPDGARLVPNTPECPAPELLAPGGVQSAMTDWWTLGVFLYEMLTGLPPFYRFECADGNPQNFADQSLRIPKELPSEAQDLVGRLLAKDPRERLGARGGALEIQSHAFFNGVNWQELLLKQVNRYRPGSLSNAFKIEPSTPKSPSLRRFDSNGVRRLSQGILYEEVDFGFGFSSKACIYRRSIAQTRERAVKDLADRAVPDVQGDDWDVVWQPASRTLCFQNRLTQGDVYAGRRDSKRYKRAEEQVGSDGPNECQSTEALAAALELGYRSLRLVAQILALGNVRLDDATLGHVTIPDTRFKFVDYDLPYIDISPLEWAVEHERPELVHLFLDAGADPNRTLWKFEGPALIKAVRKGSLELVEILVRNTSDRVTRTRALSLAAGHGDVAVARALLEGGALCDFEAGDVPSRPLQDFGDCEVGFGHISTLEPCDFAAPLPRAIRSGDVELVRLLLEHGAETNNGFHGVNGRDDPSDFEKDGFEGYEGSGEDSEAVGPASVPPPCPMPRFHFHSGQVVQLAMELGHTEMVDLLLDYGADIDLPLPVREISDDSDRVPTGYRLVPRSVYLRVMAGLREAVGKRKWIK
ncbi:hypothetical protein PG984_013371 [Apiospora sp. TS-2023a]